MIDEPKRTLDDTNPRKPADLDARLRADEPPLSADDTNPNQPTVLDARLVAEEPPIADGDTHPSLMTRQVFAQPGGSGRMLQAVAVLLLAGALILVGLAAYVWLDVGESDAEETPVDANVEMVQIAPDQPDTVRQADAATSTPALVLSPPATQVPPLFTGADSVYPTAAADEIAAALLTPAAVINDGDAVARAAAPFTIRPGTARADVVQYTVRDDDTLESIAAQFGLDDYYTIIWSNKTNKFNPLRAGNQLNILPVDGVYYEVTANIPIWEVAAEYDLDPYLIIDTEYNDLFGSIPETLLVEGMWVVLPGAEAERELFLVAAGSGTGSSGTAEYVGGTYTLWGCTANVGGGTMPYGRPLGNYTWMRGMVPGGHTGVDIAASAGDPVYASGGGTVVYAGWQNGGYGNVVVIAHGPVFTLYAHMTAANVGCGQQVSAGAVIGTVGSTGNSTGPHLHFEVRNAQFNLLNPQNWVSF
ncbi:MAG: peptidoglycan DD-metalloendopeptidase family protein [Anaerolineae bacterium]|nr:peptidoglycan DD-metalloendopeptidase family protein [Anaerolineae bacterium]